MDKKVLVIEDDPATSRLVEYTLKHHGFRVITATNGLDGVRITVKESPDLVILDVMLPGMDGLEICRRLRSNPATINIAIMIFSARAQESDRETGLKAGANDYLVKPAAPAEIIARVEKLLLEKSSLPAAYKTAG